MQDLPHSPDQRATVLTSPKGAQDTAPAAAEAAPAAKRRPLLDRLGSFAHDSHEFLNSKTGRLAVRNGMGAAWGIFWLLFPYVGVRMGMNAFANANASEDHGNVYQVKQGVGPIREALAHMAASDSFREVMAVGTSFSTYRITNKAWKFGYDMLAAPHASEEAAQATARKMPGAVGQFIKHYAPAEAASTIPAAFPLVLIQTALNGDVSKKGMVKDRKDASFDKKGWAYSLAPAWPGYWAFFSVTNTLFKKLTGHSGTLPDVMAQAQKGDSSEFVTAQKLVDKTGLDEQPAVKQLAVKTEEQEAEKAQETVVDKVLNSVKFATSIAVGITAYYAGKRFWNDEMRVGRQKLSKVENGMIKPGDNFLQSFKKEGAGLEMFFMFTVLEEATNMLLTKPFKKLAYFLNKTLYDKKPELQDAPVLVAAAPSAGEAAHAVVDNEVPQRQHIQSVTPKSTATILENGPKDRLSRPDPAAQPSYQL